MLQEAVGTGLVIGLLFGEIFGITPGGMVVPGYLALQLQHPMRVIATLAVALVVLTIVRIAGRFLLLYGRRRFAVTILLGFFIGLALEQALRSDLTGTQSEFRAIGFVVPGLIAEWMDQQGVVVTTAGLMLVAVLTRLVVILIFGSAVRV